MLSFTLAEEGRAYRMDVDGLKGLGKFCPSENVNGTDSFKATSVELSTLIKTVSRQYSMDETDKEYYYRKNSF